jgi:hypothetical protein
MEDNNAIRRQEIKSDSTKAQGQRFKDSVLETIRWSFQIRVIHISSRNIEDLNHY